MQRKKQIVFIENGASDMLGKIAFVLRKKGYKTILISLVGNLETSFLIDAYDKRIPFNFKFFKLNIHNGPKIFLYLLRNIKPIINSLFQMAKLKPYVVIARANPNWMCILSKLFFWKSPFIYFPYDMRSYGFKSVKEENEAGIPNVEIMAEKYCYQNADGIMHKGGDEEFENLNKNIPWGNIKIKCPVINFFPYCLKTFMKDIKKNKKLKKGVHVVFPGALALNYSWVVENIVKQKIHFHLYAKTAYLSKDEEYPKIRNALKTIINNKYFHWHERLEQKKLANEISKYDFGIFSLELETKRFNKYATGNKISSYLEAGIPIINFSIYETIAKIIDKYGIGINLDPNNLKNLKKILIKKNYSQLLKNIPLAREELSVENNIPRLEKFFEQVIKYKHLN